jgi:hypothetical protein
MKVELGEAGLTKTFQDEFPPSTKCVHCGGVARIAFVAYESGEDDPPPCVFNLHQNRIHSAWLHDLCSVAVYFCMHCLEPTALYDQG